MKITLQRQCQPGINCLRTPLGGVRMKTTRCSDLSQVGKVDLPRAAQVRQQQVFGANHRLVFGED